MPLLLPSLRRLVLGVLLSGAFLLTGCDGTGSERTSLYQRLTGTWTLERLEGNFDYTGRLEAETKVSFRADDGGRTYEIVGSSGGDSTRGLAEGLVALPGGDVLRMATGLERPVAWRYRFQTSTRAVFEIERGSRAFLLRLVGSGEQDRTLRMVLAQPDQ